MRSAIETQMGRARSYVSRPPRDGEVVPCTCWCEKEAVMVPIELVWQGVTLSHDDGRTCNPPA